MTQPYGLRLRDQQKVLTDSLIESEHKPHRGRGTQFQFPCSNTTLGACNLMLLATNLGPPKSQKKSVVSANCEEKGFLSAVILNSWQLRRIDSRDAWQKKSIGPEGSNKLVAGWEHGRSMTRFINLRQERGDRSGSSRLSARGSVSCLPMSSPSAFWGEKFRCDPVFGKLPIPLVVSHTPLSSRRVAKTCSLADLGWR